MPSTRPVAPRLPRWLVLAVAVMLVVSGCRQSAPPTPRVEELTWTRIALAEGVAPSSLAPVGDSLLVGGQSSTGDHPVLFQLEATGAVRPVPLRPNSPYAKVADLTSLASDGTKVFALGEAHGGAHGNFRWTAWSGSVQALTERPQTFETFGGISAGSLLDIVATADGPVIAGSWSAVDGRGLDGAIWLPRGQTWQREESAGGALANRDELQVAPRAASAHGSTMIITGSVITFGDGVQQSAAIWTWPSRDAAWQLSRLPEPGDRSEALSSACAEQCWVSGYVGGQVALWRSGPGDPVRETTLPAASIDVDGPGPRTILLGGRPGVLFSHAGTTRLLRPDGSGWRTLTAPDGPVRDAVMIGNRLYAIIGNGLWSAELA
jgi:hypothetical protein